MRRLVILVTVLATAATAHADRYQEIDKARAAIVTALDQGDAATFSTYVGASGVEVTSVWFDAPKCRKRFAKATVTAKTAAAFVACFKGLGVQPRGLNIQYGPGVSLDHKLDIVDGKPALVRLSNMASKDPALPEVPRAVFEEHRTAGAAAIVVDDAATAELVAIHETGAVFRVCVDKAGHVTRTEVAEVAAKGPTATQVRAAVKAWTFTPFLIRGKAGTTCSTSTLKLPPQAPSP